MSPSIWQIIIVVVVIAVLFGGKRLRNLGGDLGTSLKGFKKAMKDDGQSSIEHKETEIESTVKQVEVEKENSK